MRGMKLAGWAGVIGFVLTSVGSVGLGMFSDASLFDFPGSGASSAEIASFVAAHRSSALAAMVLNALGVEFWMVFGAGVWLRLRAGGETLFSACFAFGLVGFTTLILAGFVPFTVLAYRSPGAADAKLLYDLTFAMLAMSAVPTALALWAYFLLVWRTRQLPLWTAVLALIGGVAHDLLLISFVVKDGFFSLEGQVITAIPATLFVWILGTSIALLVAERRAVASGA
jgi:hypothetical protein